MSSEKRRFARIRTLNIAAKQGRVFRTLDLSREGMLLEMDDPTPVGTHLSLDVALGESVVELTGEVMRHVPQGNGRVGVGVRFERLSPKAERALRDYLLALQKSP